MTRHAFDSSANKPRNSASAVKFLVTFVLLLGGIEAAAVAQRRGQSPFPNVEGPDTGQRRGTRGGQRGQGPGCPPRGRIQKRTYLFKEIDKKSKETFKKMEYDVFVPKESERIEKRPLIIGLHGLGVRPELFLNCVTADAEAGNYLVAAPMGYNEVGYYGAGQLPPQDNPPNVSALSEQDVMNVLELMRKEFKVDEQRIYIMGQSMGGAGALYLGIKYHDIWAAVGASAPAITMRHDPSELVPAANVPMIVLHGAEDRTIPLARVLPWVAKMKALNMTYEFDELPGTGHPDTIQRGVGLIFDFFDKHVKQRPRLG